MARAHGRFGQLYVGIASSSASAEPLPNTTRWALSAETDTAEVTAFGDSNKVYVSGLPDGSLEFAGFWDAGTAQTWTAAADGTARRVYMYPSTPSTAGPYWYGTYLLDFKIEAEIGGAVAVSGKGVPTSTISKQGA